MHTARHREAHMPQRACLRRPRRAAQGNRAGAQEPRSTAQPPSTSTAPSTAPSPWGDTRARPEPPGSAPCRAPPRWQADRSKRPISREPRPLRVARSSPARRASPLRPFVFSLQSLRVRPSAVVRRRGGRLGWPPPVLPAAPHRSARGPRTRSRDSRIDIQRDNSCPAYSNQREQSCTHAAPKESRDSHAFSTCEKRRQPPVRPVNSNVKPVSRLAFRG